MKNGGAAAPSSVVAEMLKAAPDTSCEIIAKLMHAIVFEAKVLTDWSDSIIVSLFKRKGDVLGRSNYCGLKLTDVLNFIEREVENILHNSVNIDKIQFDFCPDRGTTDPIFILRQL